MESTRPIRALIRGLDTLVILNCRSDLSVTQIAKIIKLPRTTTHRILETLISAGYLYQDDQDCFRPTYKAFSLSHGFDEQAWITHIARPFLFSLHKEIALTASIASLSGTAMLVRETVVTAGPPQTERLSVSFTAPLLTSAVGRAYLAYCNPSQRDTLLGLLAHTDKVDLHINNEKVIQNNLEDARKRGYAAAVHPRRLADQMSVAVPVLLDDCATAVIAVRFSPTQALTQILALERYLPKLKDTATKISQALEAEKQKTVQARDALFRTSQSSEP